MNIEALLSELSADACEDHGCCGLTFNRERARPILERLTRERDRLRGEAATQLVRATQLEIERDEARAALERDRSKIADTVVDLQKVIAGRFWMREGRGSYAYDDDRWMREFGDALDEIKAALRPLERIAGDLTNCPTTTAEAKRARQTPAEARAAAIEEAAQPERIARALHVYYHADRNPEEEFYRGEPAWKLYEPEAEAIGKAIRGLAAAPEAEER